MARSQFWFPPIRPKTQAKGMKMLCDMPIAHTFNPFLEVTMQVIRHPEFKFLISLYVLFAAIRWMLDKY